MKEDGKLRIFLGNYDKQIADRVMKLREVLSELLPGIIEQVDLPARMIAYVYGQKYRDMICTIIPSKKGVKLGFYKGAELRDPENLLEGTAKLSRYVQINSDKQLESSAVKTLLMEALEAYKKRIS
ncbi:MAG TPA: DUF1801 domain-containing protein [Ignavibacteriaceae bacterium]|jgi:hypothetical protein|nr:DUF1801 domain-containing protein [Ignavibacteriaceae bacterium]